MINTEQHIIDAETLAKNVNLSFDEEKEKLVKEAQYEECVKFLMEKENLSRKEAEELYDIILLEHTKEIVDDLVERGLLEITGYNDEGEALFGQTELGKLCAEELNRREENEKKKKKK